MKMDPNVLHTLLAGDDATLWQTVRAIAVANGMTLPETPPGEGEMKRLRTTLANLTNVDPKEAERILAEWKKRGGHG